MFDQPAFNDYIQSIADFNRFIVLCFFFAFLISALVFKFGTGKHRSIKIPLNISMIIALGLILRIPFLFQSYWYDETFTSALVRLPWEDLLTVIAGDVHPPGYYFLVKLFTEALGHNQIVMRLPALLSGLGLIWIIYDIARDQYNEGVARWAGLIVATLPACIYYSTEARYPMLLALCLLVAYKHFNTRNALPFTSALTLASLLHVNAWFPVVLFCLACLFKYRNLAPSIIPGVAIASWLPYALKQSQDVSNGFWLQQSNPLLHIIEMTISIKYLSVWVAFFAMIITASLIFISLVYWRKNVTWIWLIMVVLPPLILWFIGVVWKPIYLPRTLLFSAILLVIPVAWYLDNKGSILVLGAYLGAIAIGIGSVYLIPRDARISNIMSNCDQNIIYATNVHTAIQARHYTEAEIWLYNRGNSTAQYLPENAQRLVFDRVTDDPQGACVISQVSIYNTPQEMLHLSQLSLHFDEIEQYRINHTEAYYLIMRSTDDG